jgi:hypothetical protein
LWVIAFFFVYKVAVIGSIYGVLRFGIEKLHSWLTTPKQLLEVREVRATLDGMVIRGQLEAFIGQLHRIRGKGVNIQSDYVHSASVEWLRDAIDDKIAKDSATIKRAA